MRTHSKENNKNSAAKKIVPAVGMLALSATMLSTSTYAWFTMNKEVEMTGLNMTATVGEGLEISLAAVDASNKISAPTAAHPEDTEAEKGWKSAVVADEYYNSIGKLKPASSTTGVTLFDALNTSDAGREASKFKDITSATDAKVATELRDTITADTEIAVKEDNAGYYVDIPVYLRTNKSGTGTEKIYYKLNVNPLAKNGAADVTEADTLYKAVRVAFMSPDGASNLAGNIISGVDDAYYKTGTAGQAVTSVDSTTNVGTRADVNIKTFDTAGKKLEDIAAVDSGLTITLDDSANYSHLDFIVRVWLEGESKSCYNDTAGQSWNIDLAFTLGDPNGNTQNTNGQNA